MKRKILLASVIILFVAGIGFLLFSPISNFIGKLVSHSEVKEFDRIVGNVIEDKTSDLAIKDGDVNSDDGICRDKDGNTVLFRANLDKLLKDSKEYNENLRRNQTDLLVNDDAYAAPSLNLREYGIENGVYGYVKIPKIDMELPIYLGANGETMSYGAAHMTFTSLPIGGKYSNCVLAGHTGYIGRIFFDNLRLLSEGDRVSVKNYWKTLNYHVVLTEVRKPDESQSIFINDDRDLLTLFTCISNGKGGFNRYYVICERDS